MTTTLSPHIETEAKSPPGAVTLAVLRRSAPVARAAARRAMVGRNRSRPNPGAGRFTRSDVAQIVQATYSKFDLHSKDLPYEPTFGSRQNVALAALTLSILEALEEAGIERNYAIELTGDVCWRFYRQWGQITRAATGVITRQPVRRLRLSVDAFLKFPFGRPGYRFDDVPEETGRSLDMRRCPVADYLGTRGAADLCAGSWCNLDFALAEMWGGFLERSETLVSGADRCDFRFQVAPDAPVVAGTAVSISVRHEGPTAPEHVPQFA
jgi:hypothetical protein